MRTSGVIFCSAPAPIPQHKSESKASPQQPRRRSPVPRFYCPARSALIYEDLLISGREAIMTDSARLNPLAQRLRRIQQSLGVEADGLLGPETLSAIEDRLDISPPLRAFSLEPSRRSLGIVAEFEVSSKALYEQRFRRPTWPGESSGVTIGIGYDIGMTSKRQIELDWAGWIPDIDLRRLMTAQGITGLPAKQLARSLSDIQVPFDVAETVFYQSTLPRFAKLTRSTYPRVHKLPADAQGMLLSLIYNRGTSLSGARRTEMAAIKPLVAGGIANLAAIADELLKMTRLWPDSTGLQSRRRKEASLIRGADRTYGADEVIRV